MQGIKITAEVAVVILNYNGLQYLREYLPDLLDLHRDPYKLIIIDNASEDNSVPYLKKTHPEIPLIQLHENFGFAGGYNRGLQTINAEFYFLVNNDVRMRRKDLDILYNFLKTHPSYAAAQPKIKAVDNPERFEYAGAAGGFIDYLGYPFCRGRIFDVVEEDNGQYDSACDIFWATGAAMLVKASVFDALGGFEEYFFAHQEEIDLCWRIQRAGLKISVQPAAVAYHKGGGTLDYTSPFKTYLNFRNNLLTLIRNKNKAQLLFLLPIRAVLDMIAAVFYLVQGKKQVMNPIFKAYSSVYGKFNVHWKSRRKAQQKVLQLKGNNHAQIAGLLHKSLIFRFYILGKKTFKEIM